MCCGYTKIADNNFVDNSIIAAYPNNDKVSETEDEFCDTTKITDFKNNLTILVEELSEIENEYQLKKANDFIKQSCERDTIFCSDIYFKKSRIYKFDNEWKLILTGYVLDQATGMEENSVSFFVLTIMRNHEFWFTDILEDLNGEIQVELNGFEEKNRQLTVWGHTYPYFQNDYGKFRLTINNEKVLYEFQCHSQH